MAIAAIVFLAGIAALFAAILVFDLDVIKWANCNAPFAVPEDKASEICRR
jgi:hypothetical protein